MIIPKQLKDEIWDYCRINNISNIDEFNLKLIKQGFTIEKYGAAPPTTKIIEKVTEVIKEVPVEVFKEVFLTDDIKTSKEILDLSNEILELKKQLQEEKNKKKTDLYGEQ